MAHLDLQIFCKDGPGLQPSMKCEEFEFQDLQQGIH